MTLGVDLIMYTLLDFQSKTAIKDATEQTVPYTESRAYVNSQRKVHR